MEQQPIDTTLAIAQAMVDELTDYLMGDTLYRQLMVKTPGGVRQPKMTLGALLVVSQFTLYGDARKGRRPSFTAAARPEQAEPLCDAFVQALAGQGLTVQTGRFGASMAVHLVNDGPVTLWLDTAELGRMKDEG